jgi:hypothetical protein
MKRGASSRTDCVSAITSCNPCSADTTQEVPEHASAVPVDAGNRYTEVLQSLKLVPRSSMANKGSYAGSPFDQSSRDASAEITGGSRRADGRGIHDSDLREGTTSMQSGADSSRGATGRRSAS